MKILLTILFLCLPTMAQEEESQHVTVLISRETALAIYKGAPIQKSDFVLFTDKTTASDHRGKESVTFRREMFESVGTANADRQLLISHLKLHIPEQPNPCHKEYGRGMDCVGPHGGLIFRRN